MATEKLTLNGTESEIKTKAEEIMKNGEPVGYIMKEFQKLHVGDSRTGEILLCSIACQSVLNSAGIQPKVSGSSGKGKTHACKAMAHLIPEEWIKEGTLSDKAVYRMKLKPGVIIYSDDVWLSPSLEGTIKRATTNFQEKTVYTTLNKDHEVKSLAIPERIAWWLTSVDNDQSLQLLNRQFGGEVDETPEQDRRVLDYQIYQAINGTVAFPETEEVKICREIIEQIKQNEFIVKIPFADKIDWPDSSNRRNFGMFLDIIKAFTVLKFKQRQIDDTGALIAEIEDFESAAELYNSNAANQQSKITDGEEKLLKALKELNGRATYSQLAMQMNIGSSRISQLLNGKGNGHDSGLLYKIPGLDVEQEDRKNIVVLNASYQEDSFKVKLKGV